MPARPGCGYRSPSKLDNFSSEVFGTPSSFARLVVLVRGASSQGRLRSGDGRQAGSHHGPGGLPVSGQRWAARSARVGTQKLQAPSWSSSMRATAWGGGTKSGLRRRSTTAATTSEWPKALALPQMQSYKARHEGQDSSERGAGTSHAGQRNLLRRTTPNRKLQASIRR